MSFKPYKKHFSGFSSFSYYLRTFSWFIAGSFLAALGVHAFLLPNQLIDGGVLGLAIMASHFVGDSYLSLFLVLFNLPFVFLAYKQIGRQFVIQMFASIVIFSLSLGVLKALTGKFGFPLLEFHGSELEILVLGGCTIGCGIGLIIRHGGSTDGIEILGIIINRKMGFTVGQVILFIDVFIFLLAGLVYKNWHSAFISLMTFVVAIRVMDTVIVGFDDTKSVFIISSTPKRLGKVIVEVLGVGLTYLQGRGGFTGENKEMLYVVVERLQLSQLKELVHKEDPRAFIAIGNLHEVINGRQTRK
ncbi:UPF0750 membrane protein YqfU [Candidatus Clavichlamydia salmonicola]|uniref:YitT family protein n=1 Tax=Candidatus Clavichlamydia salmonicola TaxID=469812 RepID=UPI0018910BF6|nr:YitT family protein [Candidatus Clavichlamydia salmonicola]MBF5051168.1 UPF0750 membrane protein YqfU [Candidatus Clavichlamydia salmonicola]